MQSWYNGYTTAKGIKIYNPHSPVKALKNNYCENYWTNTKALKYLKSNIIKEDIIKMILGEEIDLTINEYFRAGQAEPKTKEEIYSAMITLGFLSYNDGYLKIPNKELMIEFENELKNSTLK